MAEALHHRLKAPVRRLGAPRIPIAYAPPLEDKARVSQDSITDAVRSLIGYAPAS
ncbi:MAG: hypothetical protein ACK4WC_15515 [Rubrimonas sp.]